MRTYRPWNEQPWYIERSNSNNPHSSGRRSIEDVVASTPVAGSGQNNVSFMGAVKYALPVLAFIVAANIFLSSCTHKPPTPKTSNPPPITITTTAPPTTTVTTTTQLPGIENVKSKAEIKSSLEELLSVDLSSSKPVTDYTRAVWNEFAENNKSAYYWITGRTFEQDAFITRIFARDEPVPEAPPYYLNSDNTMKVGGTIAILPDGKIEILVLGTPTNYSGSGRTLMQLLANETGNAMDTRLTGKGEFKYTFSYNDVGLDVDAFTVYCEASKMAYQGACWQLIEDLGVDLSVADTSQNRENIRIGVEQMREGDVTQRGWYLAWAVLLENPELKSELDKNHKLSWQSSMKLHDLILKEKVTRTDYAERLQTVLKNATIGQTILSYLYNQLVPGGSITDMVPDAMKELFAP